MHSNKSHHQFHIKRTKKRAMLWFLGDQILSAMKFYLIKQFVPFSKLFYPVSERLMGNCDIVIDENG